MPSISFSRSGLRRSRRQIGVANLIDCRAADTDIGDAIVLHNLRIEKISSVHHDGIMHGFGEDLQVKLGKLERKMTRLPRTFKGVTVDQIEGRMRALGGLNIPIPKGPMPKGARVPKGARPPR